MFAPPSIGLRWLATTVRTIHVGQVNGYATCLLLAILPVLIIGAGLVLIMRTQNKTSHPKIDEVVPSRRNWPMFKKILVANAGSPGAFKALAASFNVAQRYHGTISFLFGLSHGIINRVQYSALVAAVIGSALIPTVIANAFYPLHHLLPDRESEATGSHPQEAPPAGRQREANQEQSPGVQQDPAPMVAPDHASKGWLWRCLPGRTRRSFT
jgi:hypothetical protein